MSSLLRCLQRCFCPNKTWWQAMDFPLMRRSFINKTKLELRISALIVCHFSQAFNCLTCFLNMKTIFLSNLFLLNNSLMDSMRTQSLLKLCESQEFKIYLIFSKILKKALNTKSLNVFIFVIYFMQWVFVNNYQMFIKNNYKMSVNFSKL